MQVVDAKPKVGSTITIDRADFLSGKYAKDIERLLVERSALVFPDMFLTDDEQLQFAGTIGEVFLVGGDQKLQNLDGPDREPHGGLHARRILLAYRRRQ